MLDIPADRPFFQHTLGNLPVSQNIGGSRPSSPAIGKSTKGARLKLLPRQPRLRPQAPQSRHSAPSRSVSQDSNMTDISLPPPAIPESTHSSGKGASTKAGKHIGSMSESLAPIANAQNFSPMITAARPKGRLTSYPRQKRFPSDIKKSIAAVQKKRQKRFPGPIDEKNKSPPSTPLRVDSKKIGKASTICQLPKVSTSSDRGRQDTRAGTPQQTALRGNDPDKRGPSNRPVEKAKNQHKSRSVSPSPNQGSGGSSAIKKK